MGGITIHTAWDDQLPNGCGNPKIMYANSTDFGFSWTEPEVITGSELINEKFPILVSNNSGRDTVLFCFFAGKPPEDSRYLYYISKLVRTGVEEDHQNTIFPAFLTLKAYPNPFNSSTTILFSNPEGGNIEITIYDILGKVVKSFKINDGKEGTIEWNATDDSGTGVSSAVYFVKAKSSGMETTILLVYLR